MISPVVTDDVELVGLGRRLHLAREQVDAIRRFRFVRVKNLELAVFLNLTSPLLPNVSQSAFGAFVEVARLDVAQ